jgi:hypothetical protein
MNEFAAPVGGYSIYYYANYYNAFNELDSIANTGLSSYILGDIANGDIGSITRWRVAKTTGSGTPDPNPTGEYANSFNLGTAFGSDSGNIIYHVYQSNKIAYYSNRDDAINRNGTNLEATGDSSYVIGTDTTNSGLFSVYIYWRVAYVTNNSAPFPGALYNNGYDISLTRGNTEMYYLYQSIVCFLEGTQILCLVDNVEKYVPIETMRAGFLVKTSCDGYKKVELIGKSTMKNRGDSERIEDRLYKLSPSKYPELKEDLFITGAHSVLVDTITDKQRDEISKQLGRIFVTDGKYRLMAMLDERAEPWASEGKYTIWHFALEHENIVMNYGVYANGLLAESCSINTMRSKSNLTIV